ncbi:MAG TPA: methionine--tRNA ligase [Gaiellaceae bacterium]|nr:methionine--tRNA ligase [Gaiellaceae bacterium]
MQLAATWLPDRRRRARLPGTPFVRCRTLTPAGRNASPNRPQQRILIAVAWPYASGPRHLGHVAGFGVPSDITARYHRLRGDQVLMVSGTDEHGTPVMVAADREGLSPRETADRYSQIIREDLRNLGLSYDLFTRVTTRNHYRVVQDLFRTLYENGYIVERTTMGAFSAKTGHTLPDRYIEGTCPICGFEAARGDQCDNCGNQLDPIDLKNPRSKIDGTVPVFRETQHLFLDLPAFAERLTEWVDGQKHWRPNVRNFSLGLLKDLKPRPITRDLDWGVPIPVPPEYAEREDKRIYVWFDAVIGYLSAAVEWAANRGTPDAWRDWWQDPEARHAYFMGKDNIVFHTVIWPSILLGYGKGGEVGAGRGPLTLPTDVVASEFLTMEGKQFSVSRGVAIEVGDFLSRYDPDPLRYFLTAGGPETQDTDFTWSEFVRRNNDELVANWGNLVNRTLTSVHRSFGAVPEPGELEEADRRLLEEIESGFRTVGEAIEAARFKAALAEAMRLASLVNQYTSDQAPWALIESDRERAGTVLYVSLRAIDSLKMMFTPFLPFSSQALHELLGYEGTIAGPLELREVGEEGDEHEVLAGDFESWEGSWAPSDLPPGRELPKPRPLFKKLDPETVVAEELARMQQRAGGDEPAAAA